MLILFLCFQLLRESEANSMRLTEQAKVLKDEIRRCVTTARYVDATFSVLIGVNHRVRNESGSLKNLHLFLKPGKIWKIKIKSLKFGKKSLTFVPRLQHVQNCSVQSFSASRISSKIVSVLGE